MSKKTKSNIMKWIVSAVILALLILNAKIVFDCKKADGLVVTWALSYECVEEGMHP